MVSVPSALPAVFAAARVSVPGALIGALIGEWLGSGQGLGSSMIKAIPRYQYNELWASIVVITVVSIVLYAVVRIFESIALSRFGPSAGKS
jgi:ABC-type nitrate/sulfonate/bicarbonate transport system permease component